MANNKRQTLIHLHGNVRLEDATKLNQGEIAVCNAETAANTELAILTKGGALVYLPSINKVEGITNPISQKVGTLETTVGDSSKGLVKDVADLKNTVGTTSVASQISTAIGNLDATVGSTTVAQNKHVAVEVKQVDGKITEVNVNENDIASASALSGVDTRLTTAEGAIDALEALVGTTTVATQISTEIGKLDASEEGSDDHVTVTVDQVDGKITGVTVTTDDIASASALSTVTATVGDSTKGLVKKVADLETAVGEGGSVASQISTAIGNLDASKEGSDDHVTVKVDQVDGKITGVTVTTDDIASANALSGVDTRLTTLIGSDTNMSARAIVQNEVAKQLESENITDSFDTLKEMAEYLSSHPKTVTDMNAAISGNTDNISELQKTLTGYTSTNTVATAISALGTRIDTNKTAIETLNGTGATSVSGKITAAIQGLDATVGSTTVATGKHVAVQVVETDGKITAVNVNESDIASASALSTVTATVGDSTKGLVKKVADLETAVGEGGSVASQISTAIGNLDATVGSTTVAQNKHVAVQVKQVDGKITEVNVNESDIASATALSGVKTTADTAVQTISVKAAETGLTANGITATKTGTNVELNFNNMVIDCGTY